ncbi:hypothetical protein [Methylomonas sp. MgM2]
MFRDEPIASCCENNSAAKPILERQRGTLIKALVINAAIFAVIVLAARYGKSAPLLSDSLDNLDEAMT